VSGDSRFGVIGGGIVGLAVARRLAEVRPGASVEVIEKEAVLASHQTGHNSGVVHAGLYYTPDSLKARLCTRGRVLLSEYCRDRNLPYQECGKLVVALDADEVGRLDDIERRARANQVPDLRRLDAAGLREIEPNAVGLAALHSPRTAITDYVAVAHAYADDIRAAGGAIHLGSPVTAVRTTAASVIVEATSSRHWEFDTVVVCAGLQADRVARLAGDTPGPQIIPFRGEYLRLVPDRAALVRGLLYPVPDPRYPFLGVHFTPRVDGSVDLGPNAVLALAREGYRWRDVSGGELLDTLRWPGFRRMARRHWRAGAYELWGSWRRRVFVERARRYVPALQLSDVVGAPAGVRAQAVDADGSLVDDFRIGRAGTGGRVVTVRNAPSPAATSSLAIAEHVVDAVLAP